MVEKRAVIDAAMSCGTGAIRLIEEPMAAAIGAGLDVCDTAANMIVDIGGGTTEIAVISLGRTAYSESVRVAGDEMDEAVQSYIRKAFNLHIGIFEAERQTEKLIQHLDIPPQAFLMIGNSLKSDVLPPLTIGCKSIHIPFHTTWAHEEVEAHEKDGKDYLELSHIAQLKDLL